MDYSINDALDVMMNVDSHLFKYNSNLNKIEVNSIEELEKLFNKEIISLFNDEALKLEFIKPRMGGYDGRITMINSNESIIEEEFILFKNIKEGLNFCILFQYDRKDKMIRAFFRFKSF